MHEATADRLRRLGLDPALRESETGPYITDNGNWIMDCRLAADAPRAEELAPALARTAGVLEHGLFMGMAARAFIGRLDGGVTDLSSAAAH
jgi:ribose 5-phosphate isomerase A